MLKIPSISIATGTHPARLTRSILWSGACVAMLIAASQYASGLDADDSCNSDSEQYAAAAAMMRGSPIESPLEASRRWTGGREADAWYREARAADLAFRDHDAVAAYRAVLQLDPSHVEALHRLAYLQAASDDLRVRNQVEAIVHSEKALDIVLGMFIQRRSLSPEWTSKLGVLRVEVLNSLAAVAAARGNFTKASGLVEMAIGKARILAQADPANNQTHLNILRLQNNLASLQAHRPLRGVRQVQ